MSEEAEKPVYKDQEPMIGFGIQAYTKETELRFAHLINTVADYSPTGRGVLETAAAEGYKLQMLLASGMSGFVCPEMKTIYLNPACDDGALIETLVHESRHLYQHTKGIPSSHHEFILKDAVMLSRAKEADAETIGAAACYEIMVNGGIKEPWRAMEEKAPMITKGLTEAAAYEGAPVTSEMLQGAFTGWYKNPEIMNRYEDSYIMTQVLGNATSRSREAEPSDYFKRTMSSEEIVSTFCADAAGKCYWAGRPGVLAEPEFLEVREKVVQTAQSVNLFREKELGLKRDDSYQQLPIRGQRPKESPKTADKTAAVVLAAKQKRFR